MTLKKPFMWDKYSDQPHVIKDKSYKTMMRKKYKFDFLKMVATTLVIFPLSVLVMKFFKKNCNNFKKESFYGIGVNLDKGDAQQQLVEELGVKSLLIRIPLNDTKNIDKYYDFIKSFGDDKQIVINLMQDREHIENLDLLREDCDIIFEKLKDLDIEFQVGTTINRAKWGFFSVVEYLNFYKIVQNLRDEKYQNRYLLGPSVIDFEYHYTIRALFNNHHIKYDKLSALLYVDRRGSPYNTQMGIFDTKNKIDMLYSLVKLTPKTKTNDIYITEVNWPLSNTAPYAPTSELECVDEQTYSQYMVEYFNIVKQTNKVQKVFWHQLIAPGYGLVDNRDGKIRKTKSFYEFKKLLQE